MRDFCSIYSLPLNREGGGEVWPDGASNMSGEEWRL